MKRLASFVALLVLPAVAVAGELRVQLRDGDLVFQQSPSSQSKAISLATGSRYTHMGIVFFEEGAPWVYEAIQPVSRTPLAAWVARGVNGHVVVKRLRDAEAVLTPEVLGKMKALAKQMLGRPYDLAFAWDDQRLYCSELVYKLYERAAGVKIGLLQRLGDFDLSHPLVQKKLRERFGTRVPTDTPVISPQAMFDDRRLMTVTTR